MNNKIDFDITDIKDINEQIKKFESFKENNTLPFNSNIKQVKYYNKQIKIQNKENARKNKALLPLKKRNTIALDVITEMYGLSINPFLPTNWVLNSPESFIQKIDHK